MCAANKPVDEARRDDLSPGLQHRAENDPRSTPLTDNTWPTDIVSPMPGPVALIGSGEFLDVMRPIDEALLKGRPKKAAILPTAAGEEGSGRIRYWMDLAKSHFEAMGVEPIPVPVTDRNDAERTDLASLVTGVGLVYLSGGRPSYLADTLRDTVVWRAIRQVFEQGAALAGCSAGACALSGSASSFRRLGKEATPGLGVIPQLAVIPHFDRFLAWDPDLLARMITHTPKDLHIVGIDEKTALVGGPRTFVVNGDGSVWRINRDASRERYVANDSVTF